MREPRRRRSPVLREMLEAAQAEPVGGMSEAEAEGVLARVFAHARAERTRGARMRPALWFAGLAAALALLAVVGRPPAAPPPHRVARETLIHLQADGKEVFIRAIAYESEE